MSSRDPSRPPSGALILSGSIGKGHDTVAEACAGALSAAGCESEIVDCMALMGSVSGRIGDLVFRSLLRARGLYDAFHFTQLRAGSRLAALMDRAATRQLVEPLRRKVEAQGADLLLSVFATGVGAVDRLKTAAGMPWLRSVVYCTDACPHSMWVHASTDLFLVTDPVSGACIRAHRPDARVAVVPAAARPEFSAPPTRDEARAAFGVPPGTQCALVMAGSWGLASLDRIASALAEAGFFVLAVAGTNTGLHRRLGALAGTNRSVVPFGFTDRVPELMMASDVVVTTPGDTCTEARLLDRPLVLLDTIPGHGRENLQLELARGRAAAAVPRPEIVVASARRLLGSPEQSAPTGTAPLGDREWIQVFLAAMAPVGLRTQRSA